MTASATTSEWVRASEPVGVAGASLECVYLGEATAPEVIDPDLPVDWNAPDWQAASVNRPPHFGELSPSARAAFLAWHHTGRRARQAPSTWALLHVYGLERRILFDGDADPQLRQEAVELRSAYGNDPEVARVAEVLAGNPPLDAPPPVLDAPVPDALQVELGRRALRSQPIDASWAFTWAWYHPEIPRREAAQKVTEAFTRLWKLRFAERFPEGFLAKPRRRRLTLEYVPANPGLPTPLDLTIDDASDVFLTPGPARALSEISAEVESELASYARWWASNPGSADTLRAVAVLPKALLKGSQAEAAARQLVEHVEAELGDRGSGIADCAPLLQLWLNATNQASVGRRDAVEIAQVLDRYGIGIEPDVRFGGRPISRRSPAVLFRHIGVPATSLSEPYAAALVALELCAAVAAADGVIDDAEQAMLVDQVHRVEGVTEAERARLDAHRLLLTTSAVNLDDVATRVVGLASDQRERIGAYLLDVAQVDGVVTDEERRTVRAVYELLGLDAADVDVELGQSLPPRGSAPPEPTSPESPVPVSAEPSELFTLEPITDRNNSSVEPSLFVLAPATPESHVNLDEEHPASDETQAETVMDLGCPAAAPQIDGPPVGSCTPEPLVALDESRLRATQRSNSAVQDLLSAIFADEEDDEHTEPTPATSVEPDDTIATLDSAHSALLRQLATREHTSRPELERAAARYGVLPDGAVEVINEAALDLTDDPVIEELDNESVTVDSAIYEEMCA